MAKGRRDAFERIDELIRRMHPYDVPEILAVPITAGSQGYLAWLAREVEQE